jgi:hypothetical protein
LKVEGHDHVAAVTYNAGTMGTQQPRTAHSLLPELEAQLAGEKRLTVEEFATRLSASAAGRSSSANPAHFDTTGRGGKPSR